MCVSVAPVPPSMIEAKMPKVSERMVKVQEYTNTVHDTMDTCKAMPQQKLLPYIVLFNLIVWLAN